MTNQEILKSMLNTATKAHPVDREQIQISFDISDRRARRMIERLREQGIRVCSSSEDHGYWIAKSDREYRRFRSEYVSKATSILRIAGKMDSYVEGQVEL